MACESTIPLPSDASGTAAEPPLSTIYGLLIGIDHYLTNPLCEPLHGAVADADAMEAFLLARGVPPANLVKLTATRGRGEAITEPAEKRPTYTSIIRAIRRLGRYAAKDRGELLIHYSGHGVRTPTIIPSTKGADGLDEGLVPYDIAAANARILRDVELSYLLAELSAQGVPTVLILDACHSGGILRSESLARPRGARCVDSVARPLVSDVARVPLLESSWRRSHHRVFASLVSRGAGSFARSLAPEVSLIAACRDREAAYEYPFDGEIRGALTHSLLAALDDANAVPGWGRLNSRVAYLIRRLGLYQTPVFEGTPSRALLNLPNRERQGLRVVDIDRGRQRVLLDAGLALGLRPGAHLEITPSGGSGRDPSVFSAKIEESDACSAWARVSDGDITAIGPGDRAYLTDPGLGRRYRVQLVPPSSSCSREPIDRPLQTVSSTPPVLRDGRHIDHGHGNPRLWLRAVEETLGARSGGLLEKVPYKQSGGGDRPDFRVVFRHGTFEILQIDGRPIPHLLPLPADAPESAARLVNRLVHLARFFSVRDLENSDRNSPLFGLLTAELMRLPSGFALGDDLDPKPLGELTPRLAAGDKVCLSVANRTGQTLHLYIVDLGPDWAVRLLHPRNGLETLPPGQEIRLPFPLALPLGIRHGHQIFKVVATTRPTNVRWLELPAIDQVPSTDRAFSWLISDPLEEFLASHLHEPQSRRSALAHRASKSWVTDQVGIEIVEKGSHTS